MKKRSSAGEFLQGSVDGESGVMHPNSKSEDELWRWWFSWIGVLGNEKASPELLFLRRVSIWRGLLDVFNLLHEKVRTAHKQIYDDGKYGTTWAFIYLKCVILHQTHEVL